LTASSRGHINRRNGDKRQGPRFQPPSISFSSSSVPPTSRLNVSFRII
jgi:hypothetical protein